MVVVVQLHYLLLQYVIVYWYCTLLLTGVETLTDYRFKYGRNPLLELPLAVNPTGCARTEPKLRNQFLWKRPHTQRTGSSSRPIFVPTATVAGEAACPYSKQFVHSKSSQYKKISKSGIIMSICHVRKPKPTNVCSAVTAHDDNDNDLARYCVAFQFKSVCNFTINYIRHDCNCIFHQL